VSLDQETSLPIEDLIIGSVGRQVNYIVVALSEEGQTLVPIPFLIFAPGVEEEGFNFSLDVPLETLENAPQIEAENWPDTLDPRWDVSYFNYWAGRLAQVNVSNLRASNVLGYEVFDLQGQDMGEVEDLIVNMDNGQISYAILELGDFLETEQELFPIPLNALQVSAQQLAFMLDVDPATLANAPAFNEDTWPDLTTPEWDENYATFWQDNLEMGDEMQMASGTNARVSSLLDYDVQTNQKEEIGEIDELVVDFQNNQVKYAILSFGGFLDIGDEEVPIPLAAFSLQPENELLLLDADEQMLEDAPELDDDFWTNPVDEEIEAEITNYWETQ
jgi:sporulation protein YlmC with PRC-barrel domain